LNNCGTTILKPFLSRWCYYPAEENITAEENISEPPLLSPEPEPLFSISAQKISDDKILISFSIKNEHETTDIEGAAIELNINKGRRTHYIDYLDNLEIKAGESLTLDKKYSTRYLVSDVYDVKAVLFGKGFKKAEATTTIDLTKENAKNIITGSVVLAKINLNVNFVNTLILILILTLSMQIVIYSRKKR